MLICFLVFYRPYYYFALLCFNSTRGSHGLF